MDLLRMSNRFHSAKLLLLIFICSGLLESQLLLAQAPLNVQWTQEVDGIYRHAFYDTLAQQVQVGTVSPGRIWLNRFDKAGRLTSFSNLSVSGEPDFIPYGNEFVTWEWVDEPGNYRGKDLVVRRINNEGVIAWENSLDLGESPRIRRVFLDSQGNAYLSAFGYIQGLNPFVELHKISPSGDALWNELPTGQLKSFYPYQELSDGSLSVVGDFEGRNPAVGYSPEGLCPFYVVLDADGKERSFRCLLDDAQGHGILNQVGLPNGGVTLAIGIPIQNGVQLRLVELSSTGELVLSSEILTLSGASTIFSFNTRPDAGYWMAYSDEQAGVIRLIALSKQGAFESSLTVDLAEGVSEQVQDLYPLSENELIITASYANQRIDGSVNFISYVAFISDAAPVATIEEPEEIQLHLDVFPNPMIGNTTIQFRLWEPLPVSISVYDMLGRRVSSLKQAAVHEVGQYRVSWNGTNDEGEKLKAGVYFLHVEYGSEQVTKAINLLR